MDYIFQNIQRLCKERNISLNKLHSQIGITQADWRCMKKHGSISIFTVLNIAEVLNIDPTKILVPELEHIQKLNKDPSKAFQKLECAKKIISQLEGITQLINKIIEQLEKKARLRTD